jgi:cell division protein FtsW
MLATQAVVNLGVVTGSLPTKGLPLPFVSFGGSALVVSLVSVGVLLSISQQAVEPAPPATRMRRATPEGAGRSARPAWLARTRVAG